jgi:hypothetical protein
MTDSERLEYVTGRTLEDATCQATVFVQGIKHDTTGRTVIIPIRLHDVLHDGPNLSVVIKKVKDVTLLRSASVERVTVSQITLAPGANPCGYLECHAFDPADPTIFHGDDFDPKDALPPLLSLIARFDEMDVELHDEEGKLTYTFKMDASYDWTKNMDPESRSHLVATRMGKWRMPRPCAYPPGVEPKQRADDEQAPIDITEMLKDFAADILESGVWRLPFEGLGGIYGKIDEMVRNKKEKKKDQGNPQ